MKTGNVSGYNDVGQVMFKSLIEAKNQFEVLKIFKKNIVKNFGPGSKYWKNLNLRKKYKKIKWTKPMTGPWIHQNIMETINNIKSKKNITGGKKVNESDGFCAVLPYYLYDQKISNVKKVIKSVANTKISEQYALAKLEIIKLAADGTKDPVRSFVKKNNSNKYFKDVILNLKKIIRDAKKPHIPTVKKYGKACSYPGTFLGSIHAILNSKNYKTAVIKLIKAGGCNCSRANFVGAYFAALNGLKDIPVNWIKKTIPARNILKHIS
ncbi:MAG: ADP-ribosylglycohydrolase family protein [Proteobacteria bacterium]|nr:ADP-ribosylglycohydrolase family protein [Pseudomonadota bacterium]